VRENIQLTGAFGISDIVAYNQRRSSKDAWPHLFPFWRLTPGQSCSLVSESHPGKDSILVVINLNKKVWEDIRDNLSAYRKTVLIQTEGYCQWEFAYQQADKFDVFMSFDSTYAWHPGFIQMCVPYLSDKVNGHRDASGFKAMGDQWRYSRRVFFDTYLFRFLPRHKKAVMVATLNPTPNYQIRLTTAQKWAGCVDLFGGGYPKNLSAWRGKCGSKIDLMRRYRYALVFENQRQPGYVSEKLLDAFVAGAVPIYWGAPDIDHLSGGEAVIPINDENAPLDKIIADDEMYQQYHAALVEGRKTLLKQFSVENFIPKLAKAIE
jgi:hypothetical protein